MKDTRTRRPRGAVTHATSAVVSVWLPKEMLAQIDSVVAAQDTDRSKFLRRAIRNALASR